MGVGTLSVRTDNIHASTFNFLVVKSSLGFPYDQPSIQEEVLETPGVDGRRWRTVNSQHTPRTIETVSDFTSFDGAVFVAKQMLGSVGRLGRLSLTAGGTAYTFANVHVLGVEPIVSSGPAVGSGANAASAATIRATWSLMFTNFTESANS